MSGALLTSAMVGQSGVMSSCLTMCISFVQQSWMRNRCQRSCRHGSSWTSKRMARQLKFSGNIWQEEFFDHILRSKESYSQKWDYVRENPVRAEFVASSDQWPWQGEVELLML